jgi:phytoene dehydrogenase-like protein
MKGGVVSMERYDVIVVGAGTAGLFCANFLARYGKKTLLLEHNHQPGGLTGGFQRKRFYFDAGDQSFESGGIMFPLLKRLGLYDAADWDFADYTLAYEHGSVVMKDQKKAINEIADLFPDQRENMYTLFSHMMRCAELLGSVSSDRGSPLDKTGMARLRSIADLTRTLLSKRSEMKEMMATTIPELYRRYLPPSEYRDKMTNMGYRNMPVGLGAGFLFTWFEDYWHYKRGLQGLMNDLAQSFTDHGGVLHCNQTVDQILIHNNKAKGVTTKDGNCYEGGSVVFAGSLKRLYTELLDPALLDPRLLYRIRTAPLSEPLTALYLGVAMNHDELRRYLKTHHTLFFPEGPVPDYDATGNELLHAAAFTEITWTSMRCPELAPPNKNSLVLQTFTSYKWMDTWGTGGNDLARPRKYTQLKKMVADQMIDTASRYIPELKDRIEYKTLGSPLSTIRYTLNPEGASCGWSMELEKSFLKDTWVSLTTPIDNLYSIGHYTFWPGGVPMAALSGACAAQMIKHGRGLQLVRDGRRLLKRMTAR